MKIFKPPKNTLILWQIRIFVMISALLLVFAWVWLFADVFLIVAAVGAAVWLFLAFFYLPKYLKSYSIVISGEAMIIKSGVFIKNERIMPNARLIYAEHYRTPLSRCFGLSGLILRATRAATFTMELELSNINEIVEAISGER